jgi:hypothetical protein
MPKTILLLASNPKDTTPLRLGEEAREIYNGLRGAKKRDDFVLQQVWAVRSEDVRRAMLDHEPQIVHFSGHGAGANGIALEDNDGNTQLVSTEALADFFKLFSDSVECVVLNACYSEVQAQAIAEHIDYVIGMNQPIGDKAAIDFAVAFYDAIGAGKDVPFAFNLACNAIQWANIPEHLTPILKNTGRHNKSQTEQKQPDPVFLLQSFGNKISRNCLFITPDLIRTKEEVSQNIVVGKTINLKHLVDNSFMERTENIRDAITNLDRHVQNNLSTGFSQLVTFWIDGKSGSGKSVLLLQILQKLVLERNAKVFWLANEFGLLEKMLIEWANAQLTFDEPIYIFIDDFNSPQNRDTLDYQSIVQIVSDIRSQDIRWPVIVTCSPPDYLEEFKANGRDEGFLVQRWTIPLINRSEQSALLEWFHQRTGKSYKTGSAFDQEEGLIVSMMFELQYGDMKEFGKRFKARLDDSGLTEVMAQPLALNRLYIWPPEQWFNEMSIEQKEALAVLNAGNDFLFTSTDAQGDGYVRVTHPHLSDAIYKAIRPKTGGFERAEDLAKAFERAFKFTDVLATKILLAVSIGGERLEDLDNQYLARRMAEIWMQYESHVWKNHAIGVAFVWTDWVRWAAREPKVKSLFKPIAPIEKAIDSIGYSHSHWGNIWLQLWESEPNYSRLVEFALVWLERSERYHYSEPFWYEVWYALLSSTHIKGQINIFSELLALGIKKLDDLHDYRWADIWLALLENKDGISASGAQELVAMGIKWLEGRESLRQWSLVWQALLKQEQYFPVGITITDFLDIGIHWLNGREQLGQWSFVWQALLKQGEHLPAGTTITDILNLGIQWLKGREHLEQWSFVWEELIHEKNSNRFPPDMTRNNMLNIGINWLAKSDQNQVQWPFVWESIIPYWDQLSKKSKSEILNQGLIWLKNQSDSNSWPFMFRKCLPRIGKKQKDLLISAVKLKFFKTDIESGVWYLIWAACIKNWEYLDDEFRNMVLNQGLCWLKKPNNVDRFPFVLEGHLPYILANGNYLNLITNWIDANPTSTHAVSLAISLLTDNKKYLSEQEINHLDSWIKTKLFKYDIGDKEWFPAWKIFMRFWDQLDEEIQTEALRQGMDWLKTQNDSNNFPFVFEQCFLYVSDERDYLNQIINWMEMESVSTKPLIMALALARDDYQEFISIKGLNRLRIWAKNNLFKTDIQSTEWYPAWKVYWMLMPTLETAAIALKWMEFYQGNIRAAEKIIKMLLSSNRQDIDRLIAKWYAKNPEHPVCKTIKQHQPYQV